MRVAPRFAGVVVTDDVKTNQPKVAAEIEAALQKPANRAVSRLLDDFNREGGGVDVEFYEAPVAIAGDFMAFGVVPDVLHARIVSGKGEKRKILAEGILPELRRVAGHWFRQPVELPDFVAQVLAQAFKEGSFLDNRRAGQK